MVILFVCNLTSRFFVCVFKDSFDQSLSSTFLSDWLLGTVALFFHFSDSFFTSPYFILLCVFNSDVLS